MSSLGRKLARLSSDDVSAFLDSLSYTESRALAGFLFDWSGEWARDDQLPPEGDWSTWLIQAGRGFGKTRAGAEWVRLQAQQNPGCRIAIVARTSGDVRDTAIEGESGILRISPPGFRPKYEPSKRRLTWPNGSTATTFTADEPDLLRGPQFHFAWCDEVASWRYPEAWDNLQFALRLGSDPRCVVTTTPKPVRLFREIRSNPSTVVSGGATYDNIANLPPKFVREIVAKYEGTTTGRQELHAELLEQAEGALWKRGTISEARLRPEEVELGWFYRVVVAIDPAASATEQSDETGIVVAAVRRMRTTAGAQRDHYYVLADASGRYSPGEWARRAVSLFEHYQADRIVGEGNNGGDMVESTVRTIDPDAPYSMVWASRGKDARAEPVAALYEQGRVHHVGAFDDLEDQMCNWVPRSGLKSPDRLDALVWCLTKLLESSGDTVTSLGGGAEADRSDSPWRL